LQQFKDDYDRNQPMWRILPDFCKEHRQYERMGLRDLCQLIHAEYKAHDVARLTTEMYLSDMIPALKPSDAFAKMAHREVERVSIDQLEGRVTGVLLTPYRNSLASRRSFTGLARKRMLTVASVSMSIV
jgi:arginine decarboxylase